MMILKLGLAFASLVLLLALRRPLWQALLGALAARFCLLSRR